MNETKQEPDYVIPMDPEAMNYIERIIYEFGAQRDRMACLINLNQKKENCFSPALLQKEYAEYVNAYARYDLMVQYLEDHCFPKQVLEGAYQFETDSVNRLIFIWKEGRKECGVRSE